MHSGKKSCANLPLDDTIGIFKVKTRGKDKAPTARKDSPRFYLSLSLFPFFYLYEIFICVCFTKIHVIIIECCRSFQSSLCRKETNSCLSFATTNFPNNIAEDPQKNRVFYARPSSILTAAM